MTIQPSIGNPQIIDVNLLYPTYMKNKPKDKGMPHQNYWVDDGGTVWGATVDSPTKILETTSSIIILIYGFMI